MEALKAEGKALFTRNDFLGASTKFSEALELDPDDHILLSNRSACYAALAKQDKSFVQRAIDDAIRCIAIKPDFAKGYVRHATALLLQNYPTAALQSYQQGLEKCPGDTALLDGIEQTKKVLADIALKQQQSGAPQTAFGADQDVVIGIDLGTTYSCVGVYMPDGKVLMVPNDRGQITTPSYVGWNERGKRFVGMTAKSMAAQHPRTTLFDVKRIIGQRIEDEGVERDISHFPFRVVGSEDEKDDSAKRRKSKGKPVIEVPIASQGVKRFAPEEVSAMVLGYLKRCAEQFLKRPVNKAVISLYLLSE